MLHKAACAVLDIPGTTRTDVTTFNTAAVAGR